MPYTLTRDELIERGRRVEELRSPSIASLYGVHEDKTRPADLLGTGIYVQHREDVFLLTAMHVVKNAQKYEYIFHDIGGNGEQMFPLRAGWTGWDEDSGDLALWGCFAELFSTSGLRPFPLVEPIGVADCCNEAFFIASGWPGDQALTIPHAREYRTVLHTVMGKAVLRSDLPAHSFAFDCANSIRYYGMNGSAVWNLNLHRCADATVWTPEMSTFAGVVTQWDKDNGLIIATRAECVKRFIAGAIEHLRTQWRTAETKSDSHA